MVAADAFLRVTVSPVLFRDSAPVEAPTAFVTPAGMSAALAYTTRALPGARLVPLGKVCREADASHRVQPLRLTDSPPTLTSSMNSPPVSEPGSLARISLRMIWPGAAEVMVKTPSLVSTGVPFWASEARTRAWVVAVLGTVHV